ncbi:hypothetical protein NDI85_19770 [Halomicroarcula sp. S1AR25-4]|uniref:hypothetical protein n=1 Tax=Haloarcula sp. S1AR25-4 TaxID=2950538 RepID=UPI00287539C9|nr:hypothetical protein [Halomicroarcula sp. S1AR25-4]MDS0280027.1 hypothetical protein [Halomicroarcula sp. S1AR25-4]
MSVTTALNSVATNVDTTEVGSEQIIDFDVEANDDYEIQSCVMVDENDRVVEAAVRFGRVETRPDLAIGESILHTAWVNMVAEMAGFDALDRTALEADLSDFEHTVPHLRIVRENVEEFDCETLTADEFAAVVDELATLVSEVLRADDETIDAEIDQWL